MTRRHVRSFPIALLALAGLAAADGPDVPKNTVELTPGAARPKAAIGDVAWIAGHWKGEALGGISEEIWSGPLAGSMMGSYRLVKDGKVAFYELITIVEESGSLAVRLKHFRGDLTGWEEKDVVRSFPLVKLEKDAAYFDGMTYRRLPDGALESFVLIRHKDGKASEERFLYRPAAGGR